MNPEWLHQLSSHLIKNLFLFLLGPKHGFLFGWMRGFGLLKISLNCIIVWCVVFVAVLRMTTAEIGTECADKRAADPSYHPHSSPCHSPSPGTVPHWNGTWVQHVSPREVSSRRVRLRRDALLAEDLRALHRRYCARPWYAFDTIGLFIISQIYYEHIYLLHPYHTPSSEKVAKSLKPVRFPLLCELSGLRKRWDMGWFKSSRNSWGTLKTINV